MAEIPYDLAVIGAGINGAAIARDAAGRGLSVLLVEQGDIAGETSGASTKLIHGGLRYLEHLHFALVRESLREREILLTTAAHLVRPLRFVIPLVPGGRGGWRLRAGLWLYDHLAGTTTLPQAQPLQLQGRLEGAGLRPTFTRGFAYSDLWTDDARLTLANVLDARERGAAVHTRTALAAARREGALWRLTLAGRQEVAARALVNAAGTRVVEVRRLAGHDGPEQVRLVQGSHLVLPRLYEGGHAYLFQARDARVVFAIPYRERFTLLGTTETPLPDCSAKPALTAAEAAYLCAEASVFFDQGVRPEQAVWAFSGVRTLVEVAGAPTSAVSREFRLVRDGGPGEAPLLSVFGGKLTTHRRLAEQALAALAPWFPRLPPSWTAAAPLPGAEVPPAQALRALAAAHPGLPPVLLRDLVARHGSRARRLLEDAQTPADLGRHFGPGLYQREVDYMCRCEWALTAEDILWRRSKCGLELDEAGRRALEDYLAAGAGRG